jgi:hypothetical protein
MIVVANAGPLMALGKLGLLHLLHPLPLYGPVLISSDTLMGSSVPLRRRFIQTHASQVRNLDV